jgi:hypothetical protein
MAISPTDIQILFTNYDIITYFLNLSFCSEHFISIKHQILSTFNIYKKIFNSDSLYAFKGIMSLILVIFFVQIVFTMSTLKTLIYTNY